MVRRRSLLTSPGRSSPTFRSHFLSMSAIAASAVPTSLKECVKLRLVCVNEIAWSLQLRRPHVIQMLGLLGMNGKQDRLRRRFPLFFIITAGARGQTPTTPLKCITVLENSAGARGVRLSKSEMAWCKVATPTIVVRCRAVQFRRSNKIVIAMPTTNSAPKARYPSWNASSWDLRTSVFFR